MLGGADGNRSRNHREDRNAHPDRARRDGPHRTLPGRARARPAGLAGRSARPAAVLPAREHGQERPQERAAGLRRQCRAAERLLDRPPRRPAPVPRAHQGILRRGRAHGCGHPRMRRRLHQGPRAGLPARPVRPAHHDQHPGRARARRQVHRAVHAGRPGGRHRGVGEVLHERPDARRVPHARGQDGRLRPGRDDGRGLHGRHRPLAHRPLCAAAP